MPEPTLHVLIGIPASGKSTLAQQLAEENITVVVSSDDLRRKITGNASDLSRDAIVWECFHRGIKDFLDAGFDVVADATNLSITSRVPYRRYVDAHVVAHVMAVPFLACCLRNDLRERTVPTDVMIDMQAKLDAEVSVSILEDEGFDAVILHDLAGGMIHT